jgi:hypothetical protein
MKMRVTKILGSLLAVGIAIAAVTATTESRAGDEELLTVTCNGGNLAVTPKAPWHVNTGAPWKWDKGDKVSLDGNGAKFKGKDGCTGLLKAFVCNNDQTQCKGPIPINVH